MTWPLTDIAERPTAAAAGSGGRASGRPPDASCSTGICIGVLIAFALLWLVPLAWAVDTALKPNAETTNTDLADREPDARRRSAGCCATGRHPATGTPPASSSSTLTAVGTVLTASLAAYALSRMRFRYRNVVFWFVLIGIMIPGQVLIVPQFREFDALNLLNTYWAVILPQIPTAIAVFIFKQFFDGLPTDLDEAARIDGAGFFRIYRHDRHAAGPSGGRRRWPSSRFVWSWNDLLWPLLVLTNPDLMTIPVGLATVQGTYGIRYADTMASAMLGAHPAGAGLPALPAPHRRRHRRHRPEGMSSCCNASLDHRSRVPDRRGRPAALRLVRRAHGPLRLHRHLRAGAPDGRRRRVPARRRRPGPRARRAGRCATRAATSSPATTGRTASARSSERPTRLDLAWRSIETNQVGVDEFATWARGGRQRADDGGQPRHPRASTRPATWSSTATIPAARTGRTCAAATGRRPARHQAVVPRQRDGRPVADRPQDRRRVRAGWPRETAKAMRRVDPSIELVACGSSHSRMPTFGTLGGDRARRDVRPRRLRLAAQLLRAARRRPGQLPRQRGRPGPVHRGGRRHLRPRPRRSAGTRKRINLSFDEWNVWYQSRFAGEENLEIGAGAAPDRGRRTRSSTRWSSAAC